MGADNETLPALEPLPSGPENVDFNAILEIAQMNGVNDARDALISQGVSPEQAGRMLESAGFALPKLAQPESVTPSAVVETTAASSPGQRAEPKMQPVGVAMDLDFFNQLNSAQSQEEFNAMYDALPAVQQFVYDRSFGQKITPAWAAGKADEFFKMQDERQQTDPAKAREQAQQAARVQSVLGIMDKYTADDSELDDLVGPAAGSFVANEWDKWNNPDRYAKRFELSFTTKTEVLEAAKYVKPLSNDERKFLEEMFPRRDDPPQVWREYFKRTREILSQGLPQQPQAQGAAPAAAAPQSSQPPPNLKPTRIDPVTGQTMTLTQNQQGKWVYRLAPQQQSSNATGR